MKYQLNKQQIVELAEKKHPLYTKGKSALQSALLSGGISAAGTGALAAGVSAYTNGEVDPQTIGMLAGTAGVTGAALGGTMHKSKDTLLNNTLVPATIAGTVGVLSNAISDGEVDELTGSDLALHTEPINIVKTTALTGGIGGASWYLRNLDKKKNYV